MSHPEGQKSSRMPYDPVLTTNVALGILFIGSGTVVLGMLPYHIRKFDQHAKKGRALTDGLTADVQRQEQIRTELQIADSIYDGSTSALRSVGIVGDCTISAILIACGLYFLRKHQRLTVGR